MDPKVPFSSTPLPPVPAVALNTRGTKTSSLGAQGEFVLFTSFPSSQNNAGLEARAQ